MKKNVTTYGDMLAFLQELTPDQLAQPIVVCPVDVPVQNDVVIEILSENHVEDDEFIQPVSVLADHASPEDIAQMPVIFSAGRVVIYTERIPPPSNLEMVQTLVGMRGTKVYEELVAVLNGTDCNDEHLNANIKIFTDKGMQPYVDVLKLLMHFPPAMRLFIMMADATDVIAHWADGIGVVMVVCLNTCISTGTYEFLKGENYPLDEVYQHFQGEALRNNFKAIE